MRGSVRTVNDQMKIIPDFQTYQSSKVCKSSTIVRNRSHVGSIFSKVYDTFSPFNDPDFQMLRPLFEWDQRPNHADRSVNELVQ